MANSQGRPRKSVCIVPNMVLSGNDCFGYYFNLKSPIPPLISAARSFRVYFMEDPGDSSESEALHTVRLRSP